MPELPEVQIVVDGINLHTQGKEVEKCTVNWEEYCQFPSDLTVEEVMAGQTIVKADRKGKYIIIELTDFFLLLHLRMTGRVLYGSHGDEYPRHSHAILTFTDGNELVFNDQRKFGRLKYVAKYDLHDVLEGLRLGVEPLSEGYSTGYLFPLLKKKERGIKNILLDQRIVAGLGNIYVCELLYRAGVDPFRAGSSISRKETGRIVEETRTVLIKALEAGGSTIRNYVNVDGNRGQMQNEFLVYGREGEPCTTCQGEIVRAKDGGRSSFYCPKCQH